MLVFYLLASAVTVSSVKLKAISSNNNENESLNETLKADLEKIQKEKVFQDEYGLMPHITDDELLLENYQKWEVIVTGPQRSVIEGAWFKIDLAFPEDYPSSPPGVKFKESTKGKGNFLFHPNVSQENGAVSLEVLNSKAAWKIAIEDDDPDKTILLKPQQDAVPPSTSATEYILRTLGNMLTEPEERSIVNAEAFHMYQTNPVEYKNRIARDVSASVELTQMFNDDFYKNHFGDITKK